MRLANAVRIFLFGLVPALIISACTLDEYLACRHVCDRYDECVAHIDVRECTRRCENDAYRSNHFDLRIEACDRCVESRACFEAEPCWDDCPLDPVPE